MESLSYRHEDDRCYGVTGMAIGLVIYDGEDYLEGVDLDASSSEMVRLSSQFYFSGNPSVSAKTSWTTLLRNFNLMTAMVISNALCRSMVMEGAPVTPAVRQSLHDIIADEATSACSLENDEMERLFAKNYNYLSRVFNHRGVQEVARDMARHLQSTRRMTRLEVLEQLAALSMI